MNTQIGTTRQTNEAQNATQLAVLHVNRTDLAHLWLRFVPILFFTAYLTATVLLFAFGPWRWPVRNAMDLYSFLFYSHLALFFGYSVGALRRPRGYYVGWTVGLLITISIVFNLVLLVPTSLSRTGSAVPDIIEGLRNPGVVYYLKIERGAGGGNLIEYLRILLAPVLTLYFPLVIFFWPWVSRQIATRLRICDSLVSRHLDSNRH